jgi:REP element-mobilizing transposase RayT
MPVYLITMHAYRSWNEDDPKGYVQRREGLKPSSKALAKWRATHARQSPARFTPETRAVIADVVVQISDERKVRLHAQSVTSTHVHALISFESPACTCGASDYCYAQCEARAHTEKLIARLKQKMGQAVAKHMHTTGRQWFSRGSNISPVRNRDHFNFLCETYLPRHQGREEGIVHIYK